MDKFEAKSICILGRQPALGLVELESLYGAEHLQPIEQAALLDIPAADVNFKRLGGTIKVAQILTILATTKWADLAQYLVDKIPEHLQYVPEGKFTLGLSTYGINTSVSTINKSLIDIKKVIKKTGRPARVVLNKTLELNSAQVLHNSLTRRGGWELLFVKNGDETILAQTLFVQDIEAYAARDQARPKRDAKVGMLPPKLAQTLVNVAIGPMHSKLEAEGINPTKVAVLDPFCGTGVVLQEALLMGYSVLGTDLEPRMVEYTEHNLQWLVQQQPNIQGRVALEIGDATSYHWPGFSALASEAYLGRPLTTLPASDKLNEIVRDVDTILRKFLRNLAPQLKPGRRICLAVPAWQVSTGKFKRLPLIDHLSDLGYNQLDFKHVRPEELLYYREGQVVARQLLTLEKA
jgi:tRNA G10  N-methylase Trm11